MKAIFILLITCCAAIAQEARVQYTEDITLHPKRIVGNKVYNIAQATNLWKMVTMRYVSPHVYTSGWIVTAKIDETNTVFILRNPPTSVYQKFLAERALYLKTKPSYEATSKEYKDACSALERTKLHLAELNTKPMPRVGSREEGRFLKDIETTKDKQAALDTKVIFLKGKLDGLKSKLDELEATGFDFSGDFVFTCAIAKLTEVTNNLNVYDRGRVPGLVHY